MHQGCCQHIGLASSSSGSRSGSKVQCTTAPHKMHNRLLPQNKPPHKLSQGLPPSHCVTYRLCHKCKEAHQSDERLLASLLAGNSPAAGDIITQDFRTVALLLRAQSSFQTVIRIHTQYKIHHDLIPDCLLAELLGCRLAHRPR